MSSAAATATTRPDTFGPTGLRVTGPLTFDEWETLGHTLGGIAKATPWLVGDWVCLGEALFGERSAQGASEEIGLKYETVMHYARVARLIPPADRKASLSFFSHDLVARLPLPAARTWLEKADAQGWNSTRLKAELAKAKALPPTLVTDRQPVADVTPKEALTMMRQDPVWADVATAALSHLDDIDLLRCPSCGHTWAETP